MFFRVICASNCLRDCFFFSTRVATTFPSETAKFNTVPSLTSASSASGLGSLTAKLFPHFWTRTCIAIPPSVSAVWITFNPQAGHEQAGRRPALVLSPSSYNGKVGLAILCPVTSQVKGYPFEVTIPSGSKLGGVILAKTKSKVSIGAFGKRNSSANCHAKPPVKFWTN